MRGGGGGVPALPFDIHRWMLESKCIHMFAAGNPSSIPPVTSIKEVHYKLNLKQCYISVRNRVIL